LFRHSPGDEVIAHRLTQGDDSVGGLGDFDLLGPHEREALTVPPCGAFVRAGPGGRPCLLEDTADLVHPRQAGCGRCGSCGQAVDVVRSRVEDLSPAVMRLGCDPARLLAESRCWRGPWTQRPRPPIVEADAALAGPGAN